MSEEVKEEVVEETVENPVTVGLDPFGAPEDDIEIEKAKEAVAPVPEPPKQPPKSRPAITIENMNNGNLPPVVLKHGEPPAPKKAKSPMLLAQLEQLAEVEALQVKDFNQNRKHQIFHLKLAITFGCMCQDK